MKNLLKDGHLTEHGGGIGTVTAQMVRKRALEVALINGRSHSQISQADWEQARRELTGDADGDPHDDLLESAPESERWDPFPGSTGYKATEFSNDDEDDDGRTDSARLVEEGVAEAQHDLMLRAARLNAEN